jgi:hypothetical protein
MGDSMLSVSGACMVGSFIGLPLRVSFFNNLLKPDEQTVNLAGESL